MRTILIIALILGMVLTACGVGSEQRNEDLTIVATTTILGDIVSQIAGDDATVEVLMPLGVDPHDFQASTRQVATINQADLVVATGLGLEEGLQDVLEGAVLDGANVLELAPLVDPIRGRPHDDPHFWLDPVRTADAARAIGVRMGALDDSVDWALRAEAYAQELLEAHRAIEQILHVLPQPRWKLVTNHDSLRYFEDQYGFEIIGTVIPGGSTLGAPSSEQLAGLVRVIVEEDVPAIFAETTHPSALARAVAAEVGHQILVVELYTGSLGEPGSGAETLVGMLHINALRIAEALQG